MTIKEIEHKIACNEMSAAQVFTQMLQHTLARKSCNTCYYAFNEINNNQCAKCDAVLNNWKLKE